MQYLHPYIQPKFQETVSMPPNMLLPPLKIRQIPAMPNYIQVPNIVGNQMMPNMSQAVPIPPMMIDSNNLKNSSTEASESETEDEVDNDGKIGDGRDKKDLKERNRIAAQKWRRKKDKYLSELESANDQLREQALALCGQAQALKVENKLLEDELQFFQSFMSKIMNPR